MKVAVQAQFELYGTVKRRGDWYVAHCPPLDLSTQGKTLGEAKRNLVEASQLFLISCLERGTLDQALKELGFVPLKQQDKPRLPENSFHMSIPIPFGLEKNLQWRA